MSSYFRVLQKISLNLKYPCINNISQRHLSVINNVGKKQDFLPFETMLQQRIDESKRTLIVVYTKSKLSAVKSIFSSYDVNKFFMMKSEEDKVCLIEFNHQASLHEILNSIRSNKKLFKGNIVLKHQWIEVVSNKESENILNNVPVVPCEFFSDKIIHNNLNNCQNISGQIQYLYDVTKMTELEWRLQFLTCRQLEWCLPRSLSYYSVLPFGSSINTFGKHGCDVDMVITKRPFNQENVELPFQMVSHTHPNTPERQVIKATLNTIAEMLETVSPGFCKVVPVLQARVPIVKCSNYATGLDCDITMSSDFSALSMSKMLYTFANCDSRVRPLVFLIRWWAGALNITSKKQPGRYFTNFQITLLVLFFLMRQNTANFKPIIPPIKSFKEDASSIPKSENEQTLENLLYEFFAFYACFPFNRNGMSLYTGTATDKLAKHPIYFENPIDRDLNALSIVGIEQRETFVEECAKATTAMINIRTKNSNNPWGIRSLILPNQQSQKLTSTLNFENLLNGKGKNILARS